MKTADKLNQEEKKTLIFNVGELMIFSFACGFISACCFLVAYGL